MIDDRTRTGRFMALVYGHGNDGSWKRYNDSLQEAVSVCVRMRFSVTDSDLEEISRKTRCDWDKLYALACEARNTLFARMMEKRRGTVPYIWQGKRLYPTATFFWRCHTWKVTQINGHGLRAVDSEYDSKTKKYKVRRRATFTQAQLRAAQKET